MEVYYIFPYNEKFKMTNETIDKETLDKLVLDICYDRLECKRLGIDYSNVSFHDVQRIKYLILSGYYEERKNK